MFKKLSPWAFNIGVASAPDIRKTNDIILKVARAGIEPATHGFSVHCSTN